MSRLLFSILIFISINAFTQESNIESTEISTESRNSFVGTLSNGFSVFVYLDRIKPETKSSKIYKVWAQGVFLGVKNVSELQNKKVLEEKNIKLKKVTRILYMFMIDCDNDKYAICHKYYYDKDGNILDEVDFCNIYTSYDDITPDTLNEALYNIVCDYMSSK